FNALSDSLKDSPQYLKDTLNGLSSLAKTVSSRDSDLHTLLANTSQVSKTLSDRNSQLQRVISDGNLLLTELQNRKAAINALLTGTQKLSELLSGLVADHRTARLADLARLGLRRRAVAGRRAVPDLPRHRGDAAFGVLQQDSRALRRIVGARARCAGRRGDRRDAAGRRGAGRHACRRHA